MSQSPQPRSAALAAHPVSGARPLRVLALAGSPTRPSRSTVLLRAAQAQLAEWWRPQDLASSEIEVRELPAEALLGADFHHPAIVAALAQVRDADVLLIATPIYKAAYSGVLKAFLDLLPQDGLRGKTVLPLGTGGSLAHLLALDYALKPVLSALGARHVLDVVYAEDKQFSRDELLGYRPDAAVLERLGAALAPLQMHAALAPLQAHAGLAPLQAHAALAPLQAHAAPAQAQAAASVPPSSSPTPLSAATEAVRRTETASC